MWHWRASEECFRQEGGEDEESSFMESTVRKTGRRICGCDRVGLCAVMVLALAMRVLPILFRNSSWIPSLQNWCVKQR